MITSDTNDKRSLASKVCRAGAGLFCVAALSAGAFFILPRVYSGFCDLAREEVRTSFAGTPLQRVLVIEMSSVDKVEEHRDPKTFIVLRRSTTEWRLKTNHGDLRYDMDLNGEPKFKVGDEISGWVTPNRAIVLPK